MAEISRSDMLEYARNAAGDTLCERNLIFLDDCSVSGSTVTISVTLRPQDIVGAKIEVRHPTDLTKSEIRTVTAVSGTALTVDSAFVNVYPAASPIFKVFGERDFLDSLISDRTEASTLLVEKEYRGVD